MTFTDRYPWLLSRFRSGSGSGARDVSAVEESVLTALQTEGVSTATADQLVQLPEPISRSISAARTIIAEQPASRCPELWSRATSSTDLKAEVLLSRLPQLFLMGLRPALLSLVQRYLGSAVAYHGAVLRHSLLDGTSVGPRLWHQDAEDAHVFRMVLYLNDVHEGGGPFEYIPRHVGVTYKKFTGVSDAITNDRMAAVVHPSRWKRITAPAGTVVIADTAKVFHHESLQISAERAVVMFGYSTRKPRRLDLAMSHFPVERVQAQLRAIIPSENAAHVFDWRHKTN